MTNVGTVVFEKDPFLVGVPSGTELAQMARFDDIRVRLLAGETYLDLSTPVDALLSFGSALLSADPMPIKGSEHSRTVRLKATSKYSSITTADGENYSI